MDLYVLMIVSIDFYVCVFQHASADVERMVLGNKCDMNDKRQVSKERGEKVCVCVCVCVCGLTYGDVVMTLYL